MKFIIGAVIIFTGAFLFTMCDVMKTVGKYDRAEEERMRRAFYDKTKDTDTEEITEG